MMFKKIAIKVKNALQFINGIRAKKQPSELGLEDRQDHTNGILTNEYPSKRRRRKRTSTDAEVKQKSQHRSIHVIAEGEAVNTFAKMNTSDRTVETEAVAETLSSSNVDLSRILPLRVTTVIEESCLSSATTESTPGSVLSPTAITSPVTKHVILPPLVKSPTIGIDEIYEVLEKGTRMVKYPSKASSKPEERLIQLSLANYLISWESRKKALRSSTLDLHSVKELRLGQSTKAFEVHGKKPELENRAFSIIYFSASHGNYKSLDLVAPTSDLCNIWVTGIYRLLVNTTEVHKNPDPVTLEQDTSLLLRKLFREMDTNGDEKLDLNEVMQLFKKLNLNLSKSGVKSTFKQADIGKMGFLNFESFERLYHSLKYRPEIMDLFRTISLTRQGFITYEEFRDFMVNVQKYTVPEDKLAQWFRKYSHTANTAEEVELKDIGMKMEHFTAFLMSTHNHIFNRDHSHVYMDMHRPLNEYYIATSHNTYLLGDQLTGESSVEAYIRVLQKGCRCVELDCWDGPNGQPIIYHGRTLTTKILFRPVIEAIAKYAFVASPYPVILSLENHCSVEQQVTMTKILREVLGDLLLLKPILDSETELPSPESMKGKVIVKGKIVCIEPSESEDYFVDSDDDETVENNVEDEPRKRLVSGASSKLSESPSESLMPRSSSSAKPKKFVVAKALSDLVIYCRAKRFEGLSDALTTGTFANMWSFAEKKAKELYAKQPYEFLELNQTQMTRIYPGAMRVKSSNFEPHIHWMYGCQCAAMNYQTYDKGMQINEAMFENNGRSGYVLKPAHLRLSNVTRTLIPVILTVQVISAQQLPKPRESEKGVIIDPFVEVEIIGVEKDQSLFRTKHISNNGFNPRWDETVSFKIMDSEFAFLRIQVYDLERTVANDHIGSYTISLQNLQEGYRHVPLYNWKGELIRFSTVFLKINIQPYVPAATTSTDGGLPSGAGLIILPPSMNKSFTNSASASPSPKPSAGSGSGSTRSTTFPSPSKLFANLSTSSLTASLDGR